MTKTLIIEPHVVEGLLQRLETEIARPVIRPGFWRRFPDSLIHRPPPVPSVGETR